MIECERIIESSKEIKQEAGTWFIQLPLILRWIILFPQKIFNWERRTGQRQNRFFPVKKGYSRINVKLKNFDGTELNGQGPEISKEEAALLFEKLEDVKEGDVLILAGSIPGSLPDSIYRDILARLEGRGILFVVDATKALLMNVLKYHPFLIKPNNHELGEICMTPAPKGKLVNAVGAGYSTLKKREEDEV